MLDIERVKYAKPPPIILGRPFLATSNAQIGCRDGNLKLTFGNMSLNMNIYNSCNNEKTVKEVSFADNPEEENISCDSEIVDDSCPNTVDFLEYGAANNSYVQNPRRWTFDIDHEPVSFPTFMVEERVVAEKEKLEEKVNSGEKEKEEWHGKQA